MSAPIHKVQEWKRSLYEMIIDVRAPSEFELDHIPGAVNMPVLTDSERIEVGTIYKQISPFEARKVGAAYVSQNISLHLRNKLSNKGNNFKPLIYCWRGGQRSSAFNRILSEIGWQSYQLAGGYKTYRRDVLRELEIYSSKLDLVVVGGYTGAGKTKLLNELRSKGEQIIDLEKLANHRGSLLGEVQHSSQPSQKAFESRILEAIKQLSNSRKTFIEAESSTIGNLLLPPPLWKKLKSAPIVWVDVPLKNRVDFLLQEYFQLTDNPSKLKDLLKLIKRRADRELFELISNNIEKHEWGLVASNLLSGHYDPAYKKSIKRSGELKIFEIYQSDCSDTSITFSAEKIISNFKNMS